MLPYGNLWGAGGGTGDFQESRHILKQIAIAQKLYTRGGKSVLFSESSLSALCKKFKMGSIGVPSKILMSPSGKICRDRVVLTQNVSPSTSFREITPNFVFGASVAQNKNLRTDFLYHVYFS